IAETKTKRSRRRIALTPLACEALRRHASRQRAERLALGPAWEEHDLVFPNTIGKLFDVRNFDRLNFLPLLRSSGGQAFASTISGTRRRPCCCSRASTPRSSRRCLGTPRLPSRSTAIAMSCQTCSATRLLLCNSYWASCHHLGDGELASKLG